MRCPSCGAIIKKRSMKCPECGAFRNKSWVHSQPPQILQVEASQEEVSPQEVLQVEVLQVEVPQVQALQVEAPQIEVPQVQALQVEAPQIEVPQVEARQVEVPQVKASQVETSQVEAWQVEVPEAITPLIPREKDQPRQTPSLIEFPGVAKSPIPQWRKELGERVREVQERRAREATFEEHDVDPVCENGFRTVPSLELLPQSDVPPMNPLVVAALERIERAHVHSQFSGDTAAVNAVGATAVAYDERLEFDLKVSPADETGELLFSEEERRVNDNSNQPERVHNLAVVPSPSRAPNSLETRKPKRLIRDDPNDPALNYLDSLPTTIGVDVRRNTSAPVFYRILSGIVDLLVVCLLSLPVVALVKLTELNREDYRVIAFTATTFVVAGFLYLTITTALTGRTLGMRLFSLRVVDARTGLIPTGTQAAGRSLVYMLSLASAGIALMFTFIDREGHAPHDRFSRTAVVRV